MQLLSICEPLFQYVCRLRRSALGGCARDLATVHADIQRIIKDANAAAAGAPELSAQLEAVMKPLVFFVDYMVRSSGLPGSRQWQPLAATLFHELAGDEKFFCLLEQELADPSEQAGERLAVYHSCLGLGFRGLHGNNPDQIQRYMGKTRGRVSALLDDDPDEYLCPQAYRHTDERSLVKPTSHKLVVIGLVFVVGLAVWFAGSRRAFHSVSKGINEALKSIQTQETSVRS